MKKIIYIFDNTLNDSNFYSSFYMHNLNNFLNNLNNTNIITKDKHFNIETLNFNEFAQIYNNLQINIIEKNYDFIMFDNIYIFIKYLNLFNIIDNFSVNNSNENINHILNNINNKKYIIFFNYEQNKDDLLMIFSYINRIFDYMIILNEYTYNFLYENIKNTDNLENFNFNSIFYIPYQIDIPIFSSNDMYNISDFIKNTNINDIINFNNTYNDNNINLLHNVFNNDFITNKLNKYICNENYNSICIITNNKINDEIINTSNFIKSKIKNFKQICLFTIDENIDFNYLYTNLNSFDAFFFDNKLVFNNDDIKNNNITNSIIYYAINNGKIIFSNIDYKNNIIININKNNNNDFTYIKLKLFIQNLVLYYLYNIDNLTINFNNYIDKNKNLNIVNYFTNSIDFKLFNADKFEEVIQKNLNFINNNCYYTINYINILANILNLYKTKYNELYSYNKYNIINNNLNYIFNNICNFDNFINISTDDSVSFVNDSVNVVDDNASVVNDNTDNKYNLLVKKLKNNNLNNNNLDELLQFSDICNKILNLNKNVYDDDIKYTYNEFKKYLIKIAKSYNRPDIFRYLIYILLINNEYDLIKTLINNNDFKKYDTSFLNLILQYFYFNTNTTNDNEFNYQNLFKSYYEDHTNKIKNFKLALIKNNKNINNWNFYQLYFNDYLIYNTYYASSYYDLMRNYYIKYYNINNTKKYNKIYLKSCKNKFKSSYQFSSLYTKNTLNNKYVYKSFNFNKYNTDKKTIIDKLNSKINIGIISLNFNSSYAGKLIRGFINNLDRNIFSVKTISTFNNIDYITQDIIDNSDDIIELKNINNNNTDYTSMCETINKYDFDIILYVDITQNCLCQLLSYARFAPIQLVLGWGHPIQHSHIDYYISLNIETQTELTNYKNNVILMSNISSYLYKPSINDPDNLLNMVHKYPDIQYTLDNYKYTNVFEEYYKSNNIDINNTNTYYIPTSVYKLNLDYFKILNEITNRDPKAYIFITKYANNLQVNSIINIEKIKKQFNTNRIIFIDYQEHHNNLYLIDKCDVVLDTYPWGSGITALEAIALGKPIIGLYGNQLYNRLNYFIYQKLNLKKELTSDIDTFINNAIRCASQKISFKDVNTECIFENKNSILELELILLCLFNEFTKKI